MEIAPILKSLRKNPVAGLLISAQIALTLAILANVLFVVTERVATMSMSSGVDEPNVFTFGSQNIGNSRVPVDGTLADLEAINALPGVIAATTQIGVPMGQSGWQTSITLKPEEQTEGPERVAAVYMGGERLLDALGVKLLEGRNFRADEVTPWMSGDQPKPPVVLISKALAERLFPGESALGKMINITGDPGEPAQQVIGITDSLASPWPRSRNPDRIVFVPLRPSGSTSFVVRTEPGERDRVMAGIEEALFAVDRNRIVDGIRDFEAIRDNAFESDRSMAVVLSAIALALLAVTAFGIVGQASFWVTQRTKQIGTRRALGAKRSDILRYFQTENALITLLGIAAGSALAIAVNGLLVKYLSFGALPWNWLPLGALIVLVLGQLAVLGPALRATRIAPAIATRTA